MLCSSKSGGCHRSDVPCLWGREILCGDVKYLNNGYKAGYNDGYGEALQEWSYILNGNKEVKKTE